ncbi:required for meiotic nuclear division protein 1 homolog [Bacillus rossius redtenbacheri]|uniref:required for meiotic nuclear division protein 1 homolog n=1 Tax=Bacillus rossius redtenbacheri TaxID=93214 RepID=UPI002FDE9129
MLCLRNMFHFANRSLISVSSRNLVLVTKPVFSLDNLSRSNFTHKVYPHVCTIRFIESQSTTKSDDSLVAFQMKKRPLRRKLQQAQKEEKPPGFYTVKAFATAEEYDLQVLKQDLLRDDLYVPCDLCSGEETHQLDDANVVHAVAKYSLNGENRKIFFFREGSVVLWNITELESYNVLSFLRKFEKNPYDENLVQDESELMMYAYKDNSKLSHLANGKIHISDREQNDLDKYTVSNAMAQSVKLGIWEASLDNYVDSIEHITNDLKRGVKIKISQEEVLRKTGELLALRHHINLDSDLLDTPDFYWDHEQQESLYEQTCAYFNIPRRTRVMNERLNHCVELVELLSSHLSDRHHVRLEWMIIVLIMVEVVFEALHFVEQHMS